LNIVLAVVEVKWFIIIRIIVIRSFFAVAYITLVLQLVQLVRFLTPKGLPDELEEQEMIAEGKDPK